MTTTNIDLSANAICTANWLVIRLLTLLAILASSLATSAPEGFMYVNPIQVRIEPFTIRVGPTRTGSMESSLSLSQAETVLGIVEDLVTDYARLHYDEIYDTDFNYVILSLVELLDAASTISGSRTSNNSKDDTPRSTERTEEEYMTTLSFSGGVGYFEGRSQVVPSRAEMQLLVELALNAEDLQEAISQEFSFIEYAAYKRGSYEQKDEGSATESGSNDSSSSANAEEGSTHNQLLNDQLLAKEKDDDTENRDSREQFIIVVASACAAALFFCALTGVLALLHHRRRKAFCRDDRPITSQHYNNKRFVASSGTAIASYSCGNTISPADAAFEDVEGFEGDSTKRRNGGAKQDQSLHLRDSLRETHAQRLDAQSETGSSRVGRLLSSASSASANDLPSSITSGNCAAHEETGKPARDGTADPAGEGHETSSSTASFHSAKDDDGDDLKCPSDFEGNAIIKPNLVPVTDTNLDRLNDDMLRFPIPPSRTASARRDEMPIYLPQTETSFSTPEKQPRTADTRSRPKPPQEGFLSKYFHPLGSVSLPYFNSTCSGDNNSTDESKDGNVKKEGEVSPRTATTAGDVDIDARWSDVSSDLGDRTDDDFEMDKAWDPDDTSVNSRENGDGFSPMAPSELRHSDEILLLKSNEQRHYNLGKLVLSSASPHDKSKRRTLPINDTTAI